MCGGEEGRHTDPRTAHQSRDAVSQGEIQRRCKNEKDGRLGKEKTRGQQINVRREKFQPNKSYAFPLMGKTGTVKIP